MAETELSQASLRSPARRPRAPIRRRPSEVLSTPLARILWGVVLPACIFAGLLPRTSVPEVLRASCLLSAYVCIPALALDLARVSRRPRVAAVLAGVYVTATLLALPWIALPVIPFVVSLGVAVAGLLQGILATDPDPLILGPILVLVTGLLAALPLFGGTVYALAARQAWQRARGALQARIALALLLLGGLAPLLPGALAELVLRRADAALAESCGDAPVAEAPLVPSWLRAIGWLHSWPRLRILDAAGAAQGATPRERLVRERAAEALRAVSGDTWTGYSTY